MGDFPAVRQLVAEAVSPVLRLRGSARVGVVAIPGNPVKIQVESTWGMWIITEFRNQVE